MLKYCKLIDEETGLVKLGAGCNDEYYQSIGMVQCDVEQSEKTLQWYLIEKCPHYTEEEKEEMERQRIAQLSLTRGDVFRGLLQAKGVTRSQIREKIDLMPEDTQEQRVQKELAYIDFDEALNFYRGVPLVDTLSQALGITPSQMTKFFETGDWHELIN